MSDSCDCDALTGVSHDRMYTMHSYMKETRLEGLSERDTEHKECKIPNTSHILE